MLWNTVYIHKHYMATFQGDLY